MDEEEDENGAQLEQEDRENVNMLEVGNEIEGMNENVGLAAAEGHGLAQEERLDLDSNASSQDEDLEDNEPDIYDNYDREGSGHAGGDAEAAEDDIERRVEAEAYVAEFFEGFELDHLLNMSGIVSGLSFEFLINMAVLHVILTAFTSYRSTYRAYDRVCHITIEMEKSFSGAHKGL